MDRFEQRIVVVTGAGSGLGLAAVARLRAEAHVCDVTDPTRVEGAIDAVLTRHGRIDGLATFAGIEAPGTIEATPQATWDRVLAVNVMGTVNVVRAVLPAMTGRGQGSIVLVSSQLSLTGGRACVSYAASKGAINALCRSLAVDVAGSGVRVNALAPGATQTPMMERAFDTVSSEAGGAAMHRHPLGRFGRRGETAAALAFLLSDDASFVTGVILPVDGGWTAL